ncbi:MAG TPA: GH25 family lysozyme [Bryobacterales bacterium]|nr:GH25 family lysozyme [Bryobacterales bacterium]
MAGATTTPAGPSLAGIDVSHYQGAIQWPTVAGTGIIFAYAKASDGLHGPDPRFANNWEAMRDAGITRGAYHFFRPAASVQAQAEQFLSLLPSLEAGDLPPMLDLEEARSGAGPDEWAALPIHQRLPLALAWLQQVEQALGIRPVVYTRRGWVQQNLGDPGDLANYPLWIAHYTAAPQPALPGGWSRWTFWQYSQTGRVEGVSGNVDLDRFNGSPDDLAALAKPAAASPAEPVTSPPESPPAG